MRLFTATALSFTLTVTAWHALAQDRCGARGDCRDGYRCLQNTCVDEATFVAAHPARASGPHPQAERIRPFLGAVVGGPLPLIWNTVGEGVQFGMRAGVLIPVGPKIGSIQLQLEVAPATALFGLTLQPVGLFDVVGTVAYFVPLSVVDNGRDDMVSWIFRVGGGGGSVYGFGSVLGFAEFRVDTGVAIRTSKHVLLEMNAPSFRIMPMPGSFNSSMLMVMWVTNVGFDYAF